MNLDKIDTTFNYKKFLDKNGGFSATLLKKITSEEIQEIIYLTSFLRLNPRLIDRLKCIKYNILEHKKCSICSNYVKFSNKSFEVFNSEYCSFKCASQAKQGIPLNFDFKSHYKKIKDLSPQNHNINNSVILNFIKVKQNKKQANNINISDYKLNKNILEHILYLTGFLDKNVYWAERFYCLKNNITEIQKCSCSTRLKFIDGLKGYQKTCKECSIYQNTSGLKRVQNKKEYNIQNISNNNFEVLNYIKLNEPIKIKCLKCNGEFNLMFNNGRVNKPRNCPKCTPNTISKPEFEIIDFIKSVISNIQIINSDRTVLNGKELDIYIPEYNIAIEYNGLMWHSIGQHKSSKFNTSNRKDLITNHLQKTEECEKQGIQLFHIFENEWLQHPEKWKNVIIDKLGLNKKIGARKTQIRPVQAKEARVFEDKNHLQGSGLSSIRYGLFYKEELVCLMTFGKSRMSKMYEYELIRFCSKQGVTIQGGASKLLKHFERKHQPMSLVSYANRRWSQGNLYKTLGFNLANISSPNYFYFKDDNILFSRNKFQKHKLHKELNNFNPQETEHQNMLNNGYRRIYDSGNFVFYKEYK